MEPGKAPASPSQIFPWLLGLLGILSLAALFTPKHNQSGESVSPHDNPRIKGNLAPRELFAVPHIPPTPSQGSDTNGRKDYTPPWKKRAEIAIAVGTVGLLVINIFLMFSTKKSADTQERSFNLAIRRAEDSDQAKLTMTGSISVASKVFDFAIANNGNVSAHNFRAHIELSLNSLPDNKRVALLTAFDVSKDDFSKSEAVEKFMSFEELDKTTWDKIINYDYSLVEISTISYENGFSHQRHSNPCLAMVWVPSPNDPQNRAHGSGIDCDRLAQWLESIPRFKPH